LRFGPRGNLRVACGTHSTNVYSTLF
jgi:hypothetical protein